MKIVKENGIRELFSLQKLRESYQVESPQTRKHLLRNHLNLKRVHKQGKTYLDII